MWLVFVQNKPNFPGDARWDEAGGPRSDRAASSVTGANHAKRTQFPAVGQGPSSGLCKTKPIVPPVPGGTGPQGQGTWGKCAKRTQSGTSFKFEVSSVKLEKSMADSSYFKLHTSSSAEGRSCETNPIPRGRAQAMDVKSATICRPHPELPSLSENGLCFPPACVEWLDSQLTRHR